MPTGVEGFLEDPAVDAETKDKLKSSLSSKMDADTKQRVRDART